jgi:prepilin-type N-terminal cleavage/methylation domain-containing protein
MQRAFTLPEVILALMLLACGGLALVSASAGAIRAIGAAEAQERATMAAQERVEQLASTIGCARPEEGTAIDSALGLHERWTVTPTRNGVRLATDTVAYADRADSHTVVVARLVIC